ncbi:hypothetical protein HanPI659440_Chr17g0701861 [Helianthus annuus]|nr:hypothetical protein HanLR1_Chr17g0685791 [Helianthus annuus]KAJ0669499.1 hypothetical protein HanPI659440_Chr17g0701861 [Helianthus annuus]KAJ0815228.1 hypothetical protein HanPSC8_Chr17g0795101 [Helianthus annuus]
MIGLILARFFYGITTFTSLMHHEITHVFQWNGEGKTPAPLVEGIADYTVLKANYNPPGFNMPGSGDRWD